MLVWSFESLCLAINGCGIQGCSSNQAKAGGLELLGWPGLHDVLILPSPPQYFSSIWKESAPFTRIRLGFVLRQGFYVALTVVALFI